MRDDSASPEMEPVSPYAYEPPTIRQRDPYKESRQGSLADRTAHLFENDEDDGVEDMDKWEEDNFGPIVEAEPAPAKPEKKKTQSSKEKKEDKEEKDAWKMAVKTAKAERKVAERWPNWKDEANCGHDENDVYFPGSGEPQEKAKKNCASCKVGHACLLVAIEANYDHGIWGRMTKKPRREFGRILKAGGTWDDVIAMRDEGFKDEDDIPLKKAKELVKAKLAEIKKRGEKAAKPRKAKKAA